MTPLTPNFLDTPTTSSLLGPNIVLSTLLSNSLGHEAQLIHESVRGPNWKA